MSLFRTKDWWRASVAGGGEEEECDGLAFCAANLDNDPSGDPKLAVGTLGGVLRVYAPRESERADGEVQLGPTSHANSEDSVIEVQLDYPILQLEAGYFSPDCETCLAVLHPRLLAVYALVYSLIGIIQGMGFSYLTAVLSTIEKQFGIKSKETAWVFSGNEIR